MNNLVHNDYYNKYTRIYSDKPIIVALQESFADTLACYENIPNEKEDYRYADGKWSIKEVLVHINDTERIMAYRALRISRGDKQNIRGFDQDEFMMTVDTSSLSILDLIDEFTAIRKASIKLFSHLTDAQLDLIGMASDTAIGVQSLAYIISGHSCYHCRIIKEKYLK